MANAQAPSLDESFNRVISLGSKPSLDDSFNRIISKQKIEPKISPSGDFKNRIINSIIGLGGAGGAGMIGELASAREPKDTAKTYLKAAPVVAQTASIPLTGGASVLPEAGLGARLMAQIPGLLARQGVYAGTEAVGRGARKALGEEVKGNLGSDTAISAGIDTVLTGSGTALAPAAKNLAIRLMENYIRPSVKIAEKFGSGKKVAERALNLGIGGSYEGARAANKEAINLAEENLQKILSKHQGKQIDIDEALSEIDSLIKDADAASNKSRGAALREARTNLEKSLKSQKDIQGFDVVDSNVKKRALYKDAPKNAFDDVKLNAEADTSKALARGLKKQVEKVTGNQLVKETNREIGDRISIGKELMPRETVSGRNNPFGIADYSLLAASFVNPKAAIALALKKLLETQTGKSSIAHGLYGLSKNSSKISPYIAKAISELASRNN